MGISWLLMPTKKLSTNFKTQGWGWRKMKPLIWIIDEEWSEYRIEEKTLRDRYPHCTIKYSAYDYAKDLEDFGCQADVILAQVYTEIPAEVIRRMQNCKGIAVYGGGYDRIDIVAAREQGIGVTNVSDYCKEDLAEYVMACIFQFRKKILDYRDAMFSGAWGAQAAVKPAGRVTGSSLLIVGLGRIGRCVAAKGTGLGMQVLAYDPYVDTAEMKRLGVEKVCWDEGLEKADFISVNAILNRETEHLITYEDFRKMKASSYLINTARGRIIVEKDLIRAVSEGLIAGAALDVIEVEPPSLKEDVFKAQGILVTPHISYISAESYAELKTRSVTNAIDFLEGKTPVDLVN
jgi:phosphoglycerate dehydrogenase-like enzyme